MNDKKFILIGLIFIVLGIILGAMGAHYLKKIGVVEDQIKSFGVGANYFFYNGIGSIAIAGVLHKFDFETNSSFRSILWGTVLFSGSIFCLVLLPIAGIDINKFLGPITPIGGVIMIFGWTILLIRYLGTYKT